MFSDQNKDTNLKKIKKYSPYLRESEYFFLRFQQQSNIVRAWLSYIWKFVSNITTETQSVSGI